MAGDLIGNDTSLASTGDFVFLSRSQYNRQVVGVLVGEIGMSGHNDFTNDGIINLICMKCQHTNGRIFHHRC